MSFFDGLSILADNVKPQSVKDVEAIYKVGTAVDNMKSGANARNVAEFQSVLGKGWIESAEKAMKAKNKELSALLKAKPDWPAEKIDALESKVIKAYKAERKKGLEPVKCKKAQAAVKPLIKEIKRHETEMRDIVALSNKVKAIWTTRAGEYKTRKDYAGTLGKTFKDLTKASFAVSSLQAEMLTYHLHCMALKTQFSEAESICKKLATRTAAVAKEALGLADMAKDQHGYVGKAAYWEDLEGRIR